MTVVLPFNALPKTTITAQQRGKYVLARMQAEFLYSEPDKIEAHMQKSMDQMNDAWLGPCFVQAKALEVYNKVCDRMTAHIREVQSHGVNDSNAALLYESVLQSRAIDEIMKMFGVKRLRFQSLVSSSVSEFSRNVVA